MSFVSNLAHSLVIQWKMSNILTKNKMNGIKKSIHSPKCSAPYKLAERDQKLAGQIAKQTASRTE
jgi:hypothetical protein